MSKTWALLASLAIATVAIAALAPAARAEFGVTPGKAIGKAHPFVPMLENSNSPFGPMGSRLIDKDGIQAAPFVSQAGAHPDATGGAEFSGVPSEGTVKDIVFETPPGFAGYPTAVPACDRETFFHTWSREGIPSQGCGPESQIGVVVIRTSSAGISSSAAVYALTPTSKNPFSFGFGVPNTSVGIIVNANVRTDGDYGVTVTSTDINANFNETIDDATVTLWGVPADPVHDVDRWDPFKPGGGVATGGLGTLEDPKGDWGASVDLPLLPFIQQAADCDDESTFTRLRVRSWQSGGLWLPDTLPSGDPRLADYFFEVPPIHGCEALSFDPSFELSPTNRSADSATGARATLEVPQNMDPDEFGTPHLRKAVVAFPEGLTVNPAAADGQQACTTAQIGLLTTDGAFPNPIRFAKGDGSCPDASKVGTAVVTTPALEDPVPGDLYLAQPFDNPFGSLFAVYLVARGPGFTAKLPGLVEVDEQTGQITTTFDHSPQAPVETVELDVFGGPRAALATPWTCGEKTTSTELTPWSAPESGPPAQPATSFDVEKGASGGPCPATLGSRPFDLGFSAGTVAPLAGEFSPFALRLRRPGGSQELDRVEVSTPKGFSANLSKVPYCPEAGIAQATGRTASGDGAVEQADPSCPDASQIGTTTIGAGAGPAPFHVKGNMYLAGPYKDAPLSAVFVVPAVAGPFDLGVQVVRAAIHVDRRTAQVTTISDVIPKILEGVPFRLQDVRVNVDRDQFTVNPSSCAAKTVTGQVSGSHGATTQVSNRFQVADCAALPFRPRLAMRLTGRKQTRTGRHPGIRAQVNQTGVGEAGIKKTVVRLPKSLALDPDNAQALCEFTDGTKDDLESRCPKGSIVGRARAVSPLLKQPLAGNVYFVKNVRTDPRTGNQIRTLPMIVVALRGEVAINLYGKSSTTRAGKLVNTFDEVPDAPISQFNININGGNNGIIAVTRTRRSNINLCASRHTAETDMDGQNGKRSDFDVRMKTPCTKRQTKAAKRQAKRAAAKARAGSRRG